MFRGCFRLKVEGDEMLIWRPRWVTPVVEESCVVAAAAAPAERDAEFWIELYAVIQQVTERCEACGARLKRSLREFAERNRVKWMKTDKRELTSEDTKESQRLTERTG